jgi:AraC-like DNA-binding protein
MAKNLESIRHRGRIIGPRLSGPEQARRLRRHLADFLDRMVAGSLPLCPPAAAGEEPTRGDGHFHLVPELFLQVAGWTRFRFPHAELELGPGEALVVPPRLLHDETVGSEDDGAPFCNIVVHAEGPAFTCHLAHEAAPGKPGILHLEVSNHPQAPLIHDWLGDAARLARSAGGDDAALPPWTALQTRALVSAALAGVLQALEEAAPDAEPEPPLVDRTRMLIQNQLGDHGLSVKGLAAQLGCTADYLSHVFSRTTGEHLAAHINRQRMERGAHLLRESGLAGKEIAWACGFTTQSYFIRNFRAHFGTTPKAWRAAHEAQGASDQPGLPSTRARIRKGA